MMAWPDAGPVLDTLKDTAFSMLVLEGTVAVAAGAALALLLAFVAFRVGQRHREAQARRLRERLVGRLHPGAPS